MRSSGIRLLVSSAVVAVVALLAAALAPAAGAAVAAPANRASYYVSLGDSLAFGYQPNLVAAGVTNPAAYRSYAEDYAALNPRLTLVNYGCPGETSTTLIHGGCPWPAPLHNSYGTASSQLAATAAFLAAHPGQVQLVSVDIGSNDLLALVDSCQASATSATALQACLTSGLPATLGTLASNYAQILTTVHTLAPQAQVVIFNLYNPLALTLPGSDALVAVVNQTLAGVAAAFHTKLADAFGVINIKAGAPVEKAGVCGLTWECTSYANIHPNNLGYAALTLALLGAR